MQRQLEANARQWCGQVPPLQLLVCPYCGPAEAFARLIPQASAITQARGGPAVSVDSVQVVQQLPPNLPNGNAALVSYCVTSVTAGRQERSKALARIEVGPISNDSFMLYAAGVAAPEPTFAQDLPVMLAICNSLKENSALIRQKTAAAIDAQNRNFAALQQSHREQTQAFDSYLASVQRSSTVRSRSVDDFAEVIRGYRTVEDTTTGTRTSVDLGHVDRVVDDLNRHDPGRYRQIPLRDEMDPLP
jgi:hypothetical protein